MNSTDMFVPSRLDDMFVPSRFALFGQLWRHRRDDALMDGPKQLFAPFSDQLLIGFLNLFWSGLDFGLAAIAYVPDQVAPGLNDEPKVFEVLAGNCFRDG